MDLPNHPMIRQDSKVGSMPMCNDSTMIPAKGNVVPQPIADSPKDAMEDKVFKNPNPSLRPGAQRMGRMGM